MGWLTRWFRRFRVRGSRDPNVSIRRALRALLTRDFAEAEAALAAAARLHSHDVDLFRSLALLYGQQGEFARGTQIQQELLLRRDLGEQTRIEVLAELGDSFRKAGFLRRAAAAYEEVLIHTPRDRHALAGLATLLRSLREHGRALEITRRLARVEGRAVEADEAALLVEQAEAAHAEGRSDDARRLARRARRRDRNGSAALVLLGTLEAERGRSDAALVAWREAALRDPHCGAVVYPRLEAAYAAVGRAPEFVACLRGLLERRPDDATARLALARAVAAGGEVDAAVAELRTLLERDGGSRQAQAALVRLLLGAHREDEALKLLPGLLDHIEREEAVAPRESSA